MVRLRDRAFYFLMDPHQHLQYATVKWFVRAKKRQYFTDVSRHHYGIMYTYVKDSNGDQRSPINNRLTGLFFSANHYSSKKSPFGDQRFVISAEVLLHNMNVYFADFYCLDISQRHTITIVLAKPNTPADDFCACFLPTLDIFNNPIIFYDTQTQTIKCIRSGINIEIFFTTHININELQRYRNGTAWLESVIDMGRHGDKAKNPYCTICNISRNGNTDHSHLFYDYNHLFYCMHDDNNILC